MSFFSLDNEDSPYDDHGGSSNGNTLSMRPMGTNPFLQVKRGFDFLQFFVQVFAITNKFYF